MKDFDDFDIKILNIIQQDGRISIVKLAKQLSLSEVPGWRRLQRLKESGIIEGYQAVLNKRKLGFVARKQDKYVEIINQKFLA